MKQKRLCCESFYMQLVGGTVITTCRQWRRTTCRLSLCSLCVFLLCFFAFINYHYYAPPHLLKLMKLCFIWNTCHSSSSPRSHCSLSHFAVFSFRLSASPLFLNQTSVCTCDVFVHLFFLLYCHLRLKKQWFNHSLFHLWRHVCLYIIEISIIKKRTENHALSQVKFLFFGVSWNIKSLQEKVVGAEEPEKGENSGIPLTCAVWIILLQTVGIPFLSMLLNLSDHL